MNITKKSKEIKSFKSTSKLVSHVDYSLGYKFKTLISYEFGLLNGKHAVRFYIDGEIESIRTISKKHTGRNFKLYNSGGQTLQSVRRQREKCLEVIVRAFFEKLGFKVKLKPRLGKLHPDILIKKEDLTCFIELKAYHGSYICGDREISQAMKYYREIVRLAEKHKDFSRAKVILITSGNLIDYQDSFLSRPDTDPLEYVKSFYKALTISRSKVKTLEDFTSRDIYNHAAKIFKKNYGSGFPQMKVVVLGEKNITNFSSCLLSTNTYDVLLMGSGVFYTLLKKENLSKEIHKFKLLKEKDIERLIINGKILKI